MAYITAEIKCPSFSRMIPVELYFPSDLPATTGNKVNGVITLLHGLGNCGKDWMMFTAACRYAADNGYILVAPSIDNSFYLNAKYGTPFYSLLTTELQTQLHTIFKIPVEREKNFIAGLSMGGYGAMLIGLSNPDKFAGIGSFSGALDMGAMLEVAKVTPSVAQLFAPIFGDDLSLTPQANLMALVKSVSALPTDKQPKIFHTCGLQDHDDMRILYQNESFHSTADDLPLANYEYKTWNGLHEWNFWDRSLVEFIGKMQNSDYADRKKQDWAW